MLFGIIWASASLSDSSFLRSSRHGGSTSHVDVGLGHASDGFGVGDALLLEDAADEVSGLESLDDLFRSLGQ